MAEAVSLVSAGTALINPYPLFEKIALAPGMRVADLGCGRTGHFVFPAAKVVGATGVVYAVEIVKNILESIKSRVRSEGYDNVQPVWSNIELVGRTPIPAESLDACFLVNVLFLVNDKLATLKEAARLLKKGGWLVIVDWMKQLGTLGPAPEKMVKESAVSAWSDEIGAELVVRLNAGEYHFGMIFKKR